MAEFKIARIRFRWIGNWANGYNYIKDDVVRYGGKTYVALKTHTSSANFYTDFEAVDTQIPPQPDPYWELMFDGYEWTGDWTVDTFYQIGNLIKKNGTVYICIESHTSVSSEIDFDDDSSNWITYTSTNNWRYNWSTSTSYVTNDIVKYGGVIYKCLFNHVSADTTLLGLEDDFSKWQQITNTELWRSNWQLGTRYRLNDIIKYGGIVYICNTAHVSHAFEGAGLEDDQSKWTTLYEGIEYKGTFDSNFYRYKLNDIVKYGASLWICREFHTTQTDIFDESKWEVYLPGFEFDNTWDVHTIYQKGDVVNYGGYNYFALTNNVGQIPSVQTDDWELLTTNFRIRGDWGDDSTAQDYKVGDVIRRGGMVYVAIQDSNGVNPNDISYWELLIPGERYRGRWINGTEYLYGDVITYISTAYKCILNHNASSGTNRPDVDLSNTYWEEFVQGNQTNVLAEPGDIKTFGLNSITLDNRSIRRSIGDQSQALKIFSGEVNWDDFNKINKVYYVAVEGDDNNHGESLDSPWATVKHACESISGPATIFIKTGTYYEELPISIPEGVALVGDELRGTTIVAAPGYETENMFYVRNATGIRNMTLKGLSGTLGTPNIYGTRRPTAGAYVSLDPGSGTSDSSVWISTRSPYIQNVTTFGTACIGLKVDGALHDGGNTSIVANDFTQVLSDGIGAWVTNSGLSELVSVFSYYGHIGYLSDNGGKIRATNGNSSYGTYGCVAEGYDLAETAITATVNNRSQEALVDSVITKVGELMRLEYNNAGQNYSTATFTTYSVNGAGLNASLSHEEIRDNAVYQVRVYTPGDSSAAGGTEYFTITNNAQGGDQLSVILAASDDGTPEEYEGMRIVLTGGTGAGQYGYISSYDDSSKVATVFRELDGQGGWENFYPGYAIENALNTTTVYKIEPRVIFDFPGFASNSRSLSASSSWTDVAYGDGNFVAIATGTDETSISSNGTTWNIGGTLPSSGTWTAITYGNSKHLAVKQGSNQAAISSNGGQTWTSGIISSTANWIDVAYGNNTFIAIATGGTSTATSITGLSWSNGGALPTSTTWSSIAYGSGVWVAIASGGTNAAYSIDDGVTWSSATLPSSISWSSVTYGNGRFVAVASGSIICAYSFTGVTWIISQMTTSANWSKVAYGQGVFLAVASSNTVAYSNDGYLWRNTGDDSTAFTLPSSQTWTGLAFGNPSNSGIWVAIASGTSNAASILTGARTIGRAYVTSGRISKVNIIEPGSGYSLTPTVTVIDPNNVNDVYLRVRKGSGVLANPVILNPGTGYLSPSTTVEISGDGYSDNYQTGRYIIINNLTVLPGPGDNLNIEEINDLTYKIITIEQLGGSSGNYQAKLRIAPEIGIEESPEHGADITIRQQYSQVRLTGHDFLEIGTGNFESSNYPGTPPALLSPENEVFERGGGRVFYTATDQNGNFRVGELFKVEQSTGTVTISADLFELTGLSEISLGAVSVGGTGVIIREFSKDSTFTADSNNIIPTQRAIKGYLEASISGGGANALCSLLTAGVVRVGPQVIGTTTGDEVIINRKVNMTKGFTGSLLAMTYFIDSFSNDTEF